MASAYGAIQEDLFDGIYDDSIIETEGGGVRLGVIKDYNEVISAAVAIKEKSKDYVVGENSLNFYLNPDGDYCLNAMMLEGEKNFALSQLSLLQYCNKKQIGKRYVERCKIINIKTPFEDEIEEMTETLSNIRMNYKSDPSEVDLVMTNLINKMQVSIDKFSKKASIFNDNLGERNLNAWVENSDKKMLIRAFEDNNLERKEKGVVRALLSTRYKIYDNHRVLDEVVPVLENQYKIKTGFINEYVMILRVWDKDKFTVVQEESQNQKLEVSTGFQIKNSETGIYPIAIDVIVSIDGREFLAQTKTLQDRYISIKHSSTEAIDLRKNMQELVDMKHELEVKIKTMVLNGTLNDANYTALLEKIKHQINKDDYDTIVSNIPRTTSKINVAKTVLDAIATNNFEKREAIEKAVAKYLFED